MPRLRTNQRANPACAASAAPVATPPPTSSPKAIRAKPNELTTVPMSSAPAISSRLPSMSVRRTPILLTEIATSGPGNPDMTM